jgi:hypothetical protein
VEKFNARSTVTEMAYNSRKIPAFVEEFVRGGRRILESVAKGKENKKTQEKGIKQGQARLG